MPMISFRGGNSSIRESVMSTAGGNATSMLG